MPRYDYKCPDHGVFEIVQKMSDVAAETPCPDCGRPAPRKYHVVPDNWTEIEGSHRHTYGQGNVTGDKATRLNRNWSKAWGEAPPPPATDYTDKVETTLKRQAA